MGNKRALIQVLENVRFKVIPYEMVVMFDALLACGKVQGFQPVITGAGNENYPIGKVHDQGYAIDVRTSNIPDVKAFVEGLHRTLGSLSPRYKVLYGDPKHLDHIHIGFSWYYAKKI